MNFLSVEKFSKKQETPFRCFDCAMFFANKRNFESHMQRKHNDAVKDEVKKNDNDTKVLINCEHCPQKFSTFEKLMKQFNSSIRCRSRNWPYQ